MSDKVIIASFGKTRTARTATQYQYNHGQKLQFENVDLPANYEVHFSNSINGTAKTVIGDSTGVVIPYEYFVPGQTIYAWIYITDEDSGITIRKVEIPIAMKAKPTDQPLEPEDESLVEQVLNRLNDTIDEIPEAIDAALEEAKESGEFDGPKGDPFTYDDFTPEQLEGLKGPKGDPFTYDDFTPEELEGLKGPKGDPFTYEDFTPEQLEALTGPQGPEGSTIWTTNTPYSYSQETGWYYFAASTLRGPTGATKKAGDLVYLSDDINQEYKAFYIVGFQYGGLQVGCRYLANMQGPPGEGATGAVLYNEAQSLTETEKNRARQNIGAASIADIGTVFRLKGSVNTKSDLPSTGNQVGDVYYVISEHVGYVWLMAPYSSYLGYWEQLGENIDINNLPNTIYWFAGTVDSQDNFTPDSEFDAESIDMYIRVYKRIPGIILSTPNGDIWLTLKLHNRMSSYSFDATIENRYYEVTLRKIINIHGETIWRYGYYSELLARNEDVGNLPQLQTTDKSSIVNAINELVSGGSSTRNVAAFSFIVELENDGPNVIAAPNYSDVYAAFEDDKVVVAKVFYRNGNLWSNYSFIGLREEEHLGASSIAFSGEIGAGDIFVIQASSELGDWSAFIDSSIWESIGEIENEANAKYSLPSGGIPKTDLASDVQTSLGKADTALQSVPSTYRTAAAQDTIDEAQNTAIAGKLSTTGNAYRALSIPMGELDDTSTATVMTATVPGITELRDGVCVWLRNGVIASASGVTLDINSLGAKPIYNSLSGAVVTTTFVAASTYLFVYNTTRITGGCWDMVYGYDANTTYTPVKLGLGYATCSTAAATAAKTASLSSYTLTTGGIVAVKFANAVPAGATLNINSKGAKAIYYKGAPITAGVIKAGDTVTMIYSTYYHVLAIDRTITNAIEISNTPANEMIPMYNSAANEWQGVDMRDAIESQSADIYTIANDDLNNRYVIGSSPTTLMSMYQSCRKMIFVAHLAAANELTTFSPVYMDTNSGEMHLSAPISAGLVILKFHFDQTLGVMVCDKDSDVQYYNLENMRWQLTPFIVTLTPTAADYSGMMDKTVVEIYEAYDAGRKVLFRVLTGAGSYAEAECTNVVSNGSDTYPSYGGYIIDINNNMLLYVWTSYTSNPDKDTYGTTIYPLASGQWTGGSY